MAEEKQVEEKKEEKKVEKLKVEDNLVVSKHAIKIKGREIKYTVTTGTLVLKEETADREKEAEGEKPRAQVFSSRIQRTASGTLPNVRLPFRLTAGPVLHLCGCTWVC